MEGECPDTLATTGFLPRALVAQWIEQEPSNLLVAGSIPAEGAIILAIDYLEFWRRRLLGVAPGE